MAYSAAGEDFARTLEGVVILDGDGSIDLSDPDGYRASEVHVAIVHDSSGFNPGAVIVVMQGWGSEDACLQQADEILEQSYRDDQEYMDGIARDVQDDFMSKNDLSEYDFKAMLDNPSYGEPGYDKELGELRDAYWTQVDEWAFAGFGGYAWSLDAEEAAKIIADDKFASKYIEVTWPEGA